MNKVIKNILYSILYIVGLLIVLAVIFLGSIIYVSEYKITTCDTAVSPDEQYKLILQAVGEPDWPFGSANGRIILKKEEQKISKAEFELRNDGGSISNACWTVTWYNEYAEVTLSGEEQPDEHIILYYDGEIERQR